MWWQSLTEKPIDFPSVGKRSRQFLLIMSMCKSILLLPGRVKKEKKQKKKEHDDADGGEGKS